jgi:hypothetical protein
MPSVPPIIRLEPGLELGVSLGHVNTAPDAEQGLARLRRVRANDSMRTRDDNRR